MMGIRGTALVAVAGLSLFALRASGEPRPPGMRPGTETEVLVPPQGGAYEAPVHLGEVCIFSFPERVAVRSASGSAKTTTLALSTTSGAVKVNVTLTVVPLDRPAYTLVRFKGASAEEAFAAQVKEAVAKQLAPLQAELTELRQAFEAKSRDRAEVMLVERVLKRVDATPLSAHQRNNDHVILHVTRAVVVGPDAYLAWEVENRSSRSYRVASVSVSAGELEVSGPARLSSLIVDRDPKIVGVVAAGTTVRGVVALRAVDRVVGKALTLTIAGPGGDGAIRIDQGIVVR
jgi:hypothetical protein